MGRRKREHKTTGAIQQLLARAGGPDKTQYLIRVGEVAEIKHLGIMKCIEVGDGRLTLVQRMEEKVLEIKADARGLVPENGVQRLGDYQSRIIEKKYDYPLYIRRYKEAGGTGSG